MDENISHIKQRLNKLMILPFCYDEPLLFLISSISYRVKGKVFIKDIVIIVTFCVQKCTTS